MLSNSCRYGIRAVIYLAGKDPKQGNTGIKQISSDLGLPAPFLAKILQQLARHRILNSVKGPNGGFTLLRKPETITLLDVVKIIDGEGVFKNCIIDTGVCRSSRSAKKPCPVCEDYSRVRADLMTLFRKKTIAELVTRSESVESILI